MLPVRRVANLAVQNVRALSSVPAVDTSIVKNLLQGDLNVSLQKKVKGVHLDAITDFFKTCDDGNLKKPAMVNSLSNLAYVSGYRRETKSLLNLLGSKIGIVSEAFTADDFVSISFGMNTMLSSDIEVRNMLNSLTRKLESSNNLVFSPAQFSQVLSSMHQLSSNDTEVTAFIAAAMNKLEKGKQFSDADLSKCMYGLHNMTAADNKTIQELLALMTEQLKASAASVSHSDFDVAKSFYGLASLSAGADSGKVSALITQLVAKVKACTAASVFDTSPVSYAGISDAWFGLQSLIADTALSAPLVACLNDIVATQAAKASYPEGGALLTPRQLGNLVYSIKAYNWAQAGTGDASVMKPTITLVQASLRNLLNNNSRVLLSTNVTSRDPQVASVQSVKEVAFLLQCINMALISNATATPRQNPHLGAYADAFVPDTLSSLPSKLPDGIKQSLVRAESILQTHMSSNAACQKIPYTVKLPTEAQLATEFSQILLETKAKPKASHRVYMWGTPCDIVIRGNFKYVFNIEYDDHTHCSRRQSYPLVKQFEAARDQSLRFRDVKIIRIAEEEYSSLLISNDQTERLGVIRDKLFDEVEDDVTEQTYTTFDDKLDTNESIVQNLNAKKKSWGIGK